MEGGEERGGRRSGGGGEQENVSQRGGGTQEGRRAAERRRWGAGWLIAAVRTCLRSGDTAGQREARVAPAVPAAVAERVPKLMGADRKETSRGRGQRQRSGCEKSHVWRTTGNQVPRVQERGAGDNGALRHNSRRGVPVRCPVESSAGRVLHNAAEQRCRGDDARHVSREPVQKEGGRGGGLGFELRTGGNGGGENSALT